jgi:2-iminobutanoate/2-iminopropanoate deaminase
LVNLINDAGFSKNDIVSITIYLTNLDDFERINRVYEKMLAAPYPARTTVQVSKLPKNAHIEINAIVKKSKNTLIMPKSNPKEQDGKNKTN